MFQYSIILKDPAMTRVNVVGFSLNLCYVLCYYIYSENKVSTDLIFLYISLSTAVLLLFSPVKLLSLMFISISQGSTLSVSRGKT